MITEANLSKLKKSTILINFVKKTNGNWDHQQWLDLCDSIKNRGYEPIDYDMVGLMLEEKKRSFLST